MFSESLTPAPHDDISVVIQGPLYRHLAPERGVEACLASVRRNLPGAEIIVSTWAGEDIEGLDADLIVLSAKPEAMTDCAGNQINTNRMLVSTAAGIRRATRGHVLKLRADLLLTGDVLLRLGRMEMQAPGPALFETPITLTNLFIRNPLRMPLLFHISDLLAFGRREDMLRFWDHPPFDHSELFHTRPNRNPFGGIMGYSNLRLVPEQALMLATLRKQGIPTQLRHPCELRADHLRLWDQVLLRNFRVIDWREAAVDFPQRLLAIHLDSLYSTKEIALLAGQKSQQRYRRMLVSNYVLCWLSFAWWKSAIAILLFTASPNVARRMRSLWRRLKGVVHPDSGRT